MNLVWLVYIAVFSVSLLLQTNGETSREIDSFEASFESHADIDKARKKNVEDPFVSFLHRMLNTGYTSSKISRNRIEKASEKRKRIAEKVEEFLAQLPSYRQEIPVVNRRPYLIRKRY